MKEATPQIYLQEIESLKDEILERFESAKSDGDELDRSSFGYEEGQVYSHNNLKKIADALDVLPRLVEALQMAVEQHDKPRRISQDDNVVKFHQPDWIQFASKALVLIQSPAKNATA